MLAINGRVTEKNRPGLVFQLCFGKCLRIKLTHLASVGLARVFAFPSSSQVPSYKLEHIKKMCPLGIRCHICLQQAQRGLLNVKQ